jgi:hypothetical protein
VPVHEQEGRLEQVRVRQPDLALLLNLDGGGAGDQLHQLLPYPAAIVAVVRAVLYAAHEEGGLLVVGALAKGGEGGGQVGQGEEK